MAYTYDKGQIVRVPVKEETEEEIAETLRAEHEIALRNLTEQKFREEIEEGKDAFEILFNPRFFLKAFVGNPYHDPLAVETSTSVVLWMPRPEPWTFNRMDWKLKAEEWTIETIQEYLNELDQVLGELRAASDKFEEKLTTIASTQITHLECREMYLSQGRELAKPHLDKIAKCINRLQELRGIFEYALETKLGQGSKIPELLEKIQQKVDQAQDLVKGVEALLSVSLPKGRRFSLAKFFKKEIPRDEKVLLQSVSELVKRYHTVAGEYEKMKAELRKLTRKEGPQLPNLPLISRCIYKMAQEV